MTQSIHEDVQKLYAHKTPFFSKRLEHLELGMGKGSLEINPHRY